MNDKDMIDIPVPKNKTQDTPVPSEIKSDKPSPKTVRSDKKQPVRNDTEKDIPEFVHPENVVEIDGIKREIFPTKLKYQRNRITLMHELLNMYTVEQIIALEPNQINEFDGDQNLFDFIVAVFDDYDFVAEHYNNMNTDNIYQIKEIYERVNRISETEERRKNRLAKTSR